MSEHDLMMSIFEHYGNNPNVLIVHTFGELLGRKKKCKKFITSLEQRKHPVPPRDFRLCGWMDYRLCYTDFADQRSHILSNMEFKSQFVQWRP